MFIQGCGGGHVLFGGHVFFSGRKCSKRYANIMIRSSSVSTVLSEAEERLFSVLTMANTGYCRIRSEGALTSVQRWFWSHVTFFQPVAVKHSGKKNKIKIKNNYSLICFKKKMRSRCRYASSAGTYYFRCLPSPRASQSMSALLVCAVMAHLEYNRHSWPDRARLVCLCSLVCRFLLSSSSFWPLHPYSSTCLLYVPSICLRRLP